MKLQTRLIAVLAAIALMLATAGAALSYGSQVPASLTISAGSSACGTPTTLTAKVLDASGNPIAGQSVSWTLVTTLSSSDKINQTPTVTGSNGTTTTTVTLACVNGSRTVRATTGDVSGQIVLTVSVGGLPNTSTLAPESPAVPVAAAVALSLLAMLLLTIAIVRRAAVDRDVD